MRSLVEELGDRKIGVVESVSANAISVLIEPDSPQATALNTGTPTGFPRINGYLLIPNESGATVGVITSVRVERLPFPKRKGMQDFGLVDLPFPSRILTLTPLGTLRAKSTGIEDDPKFEVRRGIDVFPSVGDSVALPTQAQLRSIVEGEGSDQPGRVLLGTCPVAGRAPVYFDPDKLFGRHVAVLGNTGAGKSCTVAGLVRWSLEAAKEGHKDGSENGKPNARFIVLDPNGEYSRAFADLSPRVFRVGGGDSAAPLTVPAWLWNGEEWAAFTGAAPGVQRPILFDAIRRLRSGAGEPDELSTRIRGRVKRYRTAILIRINSADQMTQGRREGVAQLLLNLAYDFRPLASQAEGELKATVESLIEQAENVEESCRSNAKPGGGGFWHNDFQEEQLGTILTALDAVGALVGALVGADDGSDDASEDAPIYFSVQDLPGFVEALATDASGRDVSQFVDSLNLRIRGLFTSGPLASVACPDTGDQHDLAAWLQSHIGDNQASNGPLAILDLSLVPSESVHILVAVLGRMVFEAIQRHRRDHGSEAPTVLVLEEAHTFVHRDLTNDGSAAPGRACCRTFEKIAREGRKFGLGLVLASQRPSEVSPTVLSQCNTFLLHRIVNDRDQDLVRRLVPDGLGDLLRELPSLPSRRAVLVGWGAPAPVLVEVRELQESVRPHSPDPAFWKVWIGHQACDLNWQAIAADWTRESTRSTPNDLLQGDSDGTTMGDD